MALLRLVICSRYVLRERPSSESPAVGGKIVDRRLRPRVSLFCSLKCSIVIQLLVVGAYHGEHFAAEARGIGKRGVADFFTIHAAPLNLSVRFYCLPCGHTGGNPIRLSGFFFLFLMGVD